MHDSIDVPVATAAFVAVLVGVATFFLPGDKQDICPSPQAGPQNPWEICRVDGVAKTQQSPLHGTMR